MDFFQKLLNKAQTSTLINQSAQLQQHLKILTLATQELELLTQEIFQENLAVEDFKPNRPSNLSCYDKNPEPFKEAFFEQIPTKLLQSPYKIVAESLFSSLSPEGFLFQEEKEYLKDHYGSSFDDVLTLIQQETNLGFEDRLEFWKHLLEQQGESKHCVDLITHYKQELLRGDFKTLIKITSSDPATFKTHYLDRLKALPLAPRQSKAYQQLLPPLDIIIQQQEDSFQFEIKNPLPSFTLSALTSSHEVHVKAFYKPFLDQLQCFITGVKKRQATLERLTKKIMILQKEYLSGDRSTPLALNPKQLAHEMGIHPSTLARCLQNKTVLCPQGVISLKSLVTPSSFHEDKNILLSQIRSIISKENKDKPYSDEKLLQILKTKGSKLSRRALTKYRHQLKIPDARRRFFT